MSGQILTPRVGQCRNPLVLMGKGLNQGFVGCRCAGGPFKIYWGVMIGKRLVQSYVRYNFRLGEKSNQRPKLIRFPHCGVGRFYNRNFMARPSARW